MCCLSKEEGEKHPCFLAIGNVGIAELVFHGFFLECDTMPISQDDQADHDQKAE